jgi:MFS family permease
MTTGTYAAVDRAALQTRTTRVLVGSQVLGGVGVASGIVVTGLLAEQVSGSTTLSGFAGTTAVLGAALAAVPLAAYLLGPRPPRRARHGLGGRRVRRRGHDRRGRARALLLLLVGALLFGFATAANLQARYAATDLATPERRGRALALVVWATTVGAVAGPNLTRPGQRSRSGSPSTSSPGRSSSRSSRSSSVGCSSW